LFLDRPSQLGYVKATYTQFNFKLGLGIKLGQ
jgi:hypothetical protein